MRNKEPKIFRLKPIPFWPTQFLLGTFSHSSQFQSYYLLGVGFFLYFYNYNASCRILIFFARICRLPCTCRTNESQRKPRNVLRHPPAKYFLGIPPLHQATLPPTGLHFIYRRRPIRKSSNFEMLLILGNCFFPGRCVDAARTSRWTTRCRRPKILGPV